MESAAHAPRLAARHAALWLLAAPLLLRLMAVPLAAQQSGSAQNPGTPKNGTPESPVSGPSRAPVPGAQGARTTLRVGVWHKIKVPVHGGPGVRLPALRIYARTGYQSSEP
jgi:hypothetical protein